MLIYYAIKYFPLFLDLQVNMSFCSMSNVGMLETSLKRDNNFVKALYQECSQLSQPKSFSNLIGFVMFHLNYVGSLYPCQFYSSNVSWYIYVYVHLPLQTSGPMRYGGKLLHKCIPESSGFEQM